ncbi:hypothetical protein BD413DRAFT_613282 [Trametes elegans]|nr:hypothetical protein BD413DRAFT_613282 [Trametes elegans]
MSASSGQTYGQHLPDQVEKIASLSDAQLELLEDVRELHKERASLEREYATKLQLLAKKAAEKKARKMPALVVGPEPTKAWDETTLTKSTLDKAYSQLITAMTDASQDHVNLADTLSSQVVEPLRATGRKHEETKKKEMQYYQKLLAERDRVYADRIKYDEECTEVEAYRQKQERAADDRHAERAARQYEQQQVDMLNSKNTYLISIAVANKVKAKFYSDHLPALEDELQDLQSRLLTRFVSILKDAQEIQLKHLESLRSHLTDTQAALSAVNPPADQDLFIDHNVAPFTLPPDLSFEPSPIHYDRADMSVEPAPKATAGKETEQLGKLVVAYTSDNKLGNVDEVLDLPADCTGTRQGGHGHGSTLSISSISRSSSVVSRTESLTGGAQATPTPSSFARTSNVVEDRGPTARVLFDFSPTSPFELAVTAESVVHVLEEDDGSGWVKTSGDYVRGLYAYKAQGPDEIDVEEGKMIRLTDGPTGGRNYADGWWEGVDASGKKGIFPSNYVEAA